jgi:hypothetical protein
MRVQPSNNLHLTEMKKCGICQQAGHNRRTCKNIFTNFPVSYAEIPNSPAKGLRKLKLDFVSLVQSSEEKCESVMKDNGLLHTPPEIFCWRCTRLLVVCKDTWRCSCGIKVVDPHLLYTPFWTFKSGGSQLTCKQLLMITSLFALKTPQDAAASLSGCAPRRCDKVYSMLRFATAFSELRRSRDVIFKKETVEIDVAKNAIRREGVLTEHRGRIICVRSRATGDFALYPLHDRKTHRLGQALETKAEVLLALRQHVSPDCIVFSDAGAGIRSALKARGNAHASVVHRRKEFARLVQVNKRLAVCGNNMCESMFAKLKHTARRYNLDRSRMSTNTHVKVLSCSFMAKDRTPSDVLSALRDYTTWASANSLCPRKAFKHMEWVYGDDPDVAGIGGDSEMLPATA